MTKSNERIWKIMIVATIVVAVLLLFSHTYNDIVITTRHGMNLWDILFSGHFVDFYECNITESGNTYYTVLQSCAYNILIYIVFAVWNIPLVLLEKFAGVDVMNNMLCLAYSKLLVVAVALVSAKIVSKIMELLDVSEKDRKLFTYLYLTSTLMLSVSLIIAQYDILSVIFQLLGLKAFLEKKDRQFVLWFGIAVCFKYFALIMFVPLLVLRYKKIVPWIVGLLQVCILPIVTKLPFMFSAMAEGGTSAGKDMILRLFGKMLEFSRSELSIFVILYVLCIVWCYFQNEEEDMQMYRQKAVWAVFAAYSMFFSFLSMYPYWSILLAPYIVMVIAMSKRNLYANLLLETCGMAGLVVANMLVYFWCYFGNTMKSMLLAKILGTVPDPSRYINAAMNLMRELNLFPVFNSVFIACMGAIAYLTYPKRLARVGTLTLDWNTCMDVLILRWIVTTLICLLPILSLFV